LTEDSTDGDQDLSMSFRIDDKTPAVGPGTYVTGEGRSAVTPGQDELRFSASVEVSHTLRQEFLVGGEAKSDLAAEFIFRMPAAEIEWSYDAWTDLYVADSEDQFSSSNIATVVNLTKSQTIVLIFNTPVSNTGVLTGGVGDLIAVSVELSAGGVFSSDDSMGQRGRLYFRMLLTHVDCNQNDVYDPRDIGGGTSTDCNTDGIPDDCEFDCNVNGKGDTCEILEGASDDCNDNGVPDGCDNWVGDETDCNNNSIPDGCDTQSGILHDNNQNSFPDECEAAILHVKPSASGAKSGTSWDDAYPDLQFALQHAARAGGTVQQIWVASGHYVPSKRTDPLDPRSATFLLPSIELYGGFSGNETQLSQRDPQANQTVLTGDRMGDDQPNFLNRLDNAHHVLMQLENSAPSTLDGFIVRGGYATAGSPHGGAPGMSGAGLLAYGDVTLRNCTFEDNRGGTITVAGGGGAVAMMYQGPDDETGPLLWQNCVFQNNESSGSGGSLLFEYGSLTLRDCIFEGNQARIGGAIYGGFGTLHLDGCKFANNIATAFSTPIGGGAMASEGIEDLRIANSVFEGNSAELGGALNLRHVQMMEITSTIFTKNTASSYGGAIGALYGQQARISVCVFHDNDAMSGGALYSYSIVGDAVFVLDCVFQENRAEFSGGAIYSGSDFDGEIVVSRSTFDRNRAGFDGGALFREASYESHANVNDCSFIGNGAGKKGGALMLDNGAARVERCDFQSNGAIQGGAIHSSDGSLFLKQTRFQWNSAMEGGAILAAGASVEARRSIFNENYASIGGGMLIAEAPGSAILDSLLTHNWADYYGGAIAGGSHELLIQRSTIAANSAGDLGGGLLAPRGLIVQDSILWDNVVNPNGGAFDDEHAQIDGLDFARVDYSIVQGWSGKFEGDGTIGLDPLFVEPIGADGHPGTGDEDFHLLDASPAINAGDPSYVPEHRDADLDGHARVLCGQVDMGAYESGIGDADCNGIIDLSDLSIWVSCAEGIEESGDCSMMDFDRDGDFDLLDFAGMQRMDWDQ